MSIHSVEQVLWDLLVDPQKQAALAATPDAFLAGYQLTEEEKCLVEGWDVRAIAERGGSPMLTMMAWMAVRGQDEMPEYMRRMNTPAA